MNIVLFGSQASGKGTQAELISNKYKLCHVSPGELLRSEVAKSTQLGKKIKDFIDRGVLVPHDITYKLVKEKLSHNSCKSGFILDGFPRAQEQADWLDANYSVDCVIVLNLDDKTAIERIKGRIECTKCHANYGLASPPKKKGVCDKCGSKLTSRADDTPLAIKRRIAIYHTETEPLVAHYKKNNKCLIVDAGRDIDSVFKDIDKFLKTLTV